MQHAGKGSAGLHSILVKFRDFLLCIPEFFSRKNLFSNLVSPEQFFLACFLLHASRDNKTLYKHFYQDDMCRSISSGLLRNPSLLMSSIMKYTSLFTSWNLLSRSSMKSSKSFMCRKTASIM